MRESSAKLSGRLRREGPLEPKDRPGNMEAAGSDVEAVSAPNSLHVRLGRAKGTFVQTPPRPQALVGRHKLRQYPYTPNLHSHLVDKKPLVVKVIRP